MVRLQFKSILCNKCLILVWLFLTSASPFMFYSWPGHPYKILLLLLLCIMIMQLIKVRKVKFNIDVFAVCVILFFFNIFLFVYFADVAYFALITQILSLIVLNLYIYNFIGYHCFIKSFIYIMVGMAIGGTIIFWLHLLVGVSPLFSVDYGGHSYSHFLYLTCTNSYTNVDSVRILRYAGFFDESGAFSLYSFYAILLNKLYLKNNQIEKLLIICTLFSLSLAFFVSIIIYFVLFYVGKSNYKKILPFLIIVFISFMYINEHKNENGTFNRLAELTIDRFEHSDDGDMKGDSRKKYMIADKEVFLQNMLLGGGRNAVEGANVYGILGAYGLIGTFIYYFPLYLLFYRILQTPREYRLEGLKILFLFLINLYHRPNITQVFNMILIFCFCEYYAQVIRNKNNSVNSLPNI